MKLSLSEWLQSRNPPAPANLHDRMLAEVDKLGFLDVEVTPNSLADAGASILKTLDDIGCSERAAALDLLAADALFTYAFEAAAESKSEIEAAAGYVLEKVTGR